MKSDLAEIIFILDRNSSMARLEENAIGVFNSMIEKKAEDGKAYMSTILFDLENKLLRNRLGIIPENIPSWPPYIGGGEMYDSRHTGSIVLVGLTTLFPASFVVNIVAIFLAFPEFLILSYPVV